MTEPKTRPTLWTVPLLVLLVIFLAVYVSAFFGFPHDLVISRVCRRIKPVCEAIHRDWRIIDRTRSQATAHRLAFRDSCLARDTLRQ